MLDQNTQDEIVRRLVETLRPERIILFGSHVWGVPTADSDVDLFIIMAEIKEPGYRLASRAYKGLRGLRVPIDFVIRSRAEVDSTREVAGSLEHEVMSRGRTLYDA